VKDNPTYACDRCGVPVELQLLVPVLKEHWCQFCYDTVHRAPAQCAQCADGMACSKHPDLSVPEKYRS